MPLFSAYFLSWPSPSSRCCFESNYFFVPQLSSEKRGGALGESAAVACCSFSLCVRKEVKKLFSINGGDRA